MPTILQAITRLSPTGLQGVRDMLMRDEVGPRKFANQRLITEPDGQAPDDLQRWPREGKSPTDLTIGALRNLTAGCLETRLPVLPHLRSNPESFSWPHYPYQPLIQPLCSQSKPANPDRILWTGLATFLLQRNGPVQTQWLAMEGDWSSPCTCGDGDGEVQRHASLPFLCSSST